MQHYELTVLVRAEENLADISALITQVGAKNIHEEQLGRKKLAYPIEKETSAVYSVYTFDADNTVLAELERKLRQHELVLRHLVIAGGIRQPKKVTKKLSEKDLEVPESLTKGMAELAEAKAEEAKKATPKKSEPETETPVTTTPEAVAETGEAEELTSDERQKKLDEKLKSILGE